VRVIRENGSDQWLGISGWWGKLCGRSQSGRIKVNQALSNQTSGSVVGVLARPHPALSPRRGCLLGPRRAWRKRPLGRTVKFSQAQSSQIKPELATNRSGKDLFWNAEQGRRTQGTKEASATRSRRIKEYQIESNRIKPVGVQDGLMVDGGQWLVASCWWRKRRAESTPVKPSQTKTMKEMLTNKVKQSSPGGDIDAGRLRCLCDLLSKELASPPRTAWFSRISGPIIAGQSRPVQPNQTKSNQIKPNQTKSNQIKPNQTKSNQIKPNQTCGGCGVD
jgi:hypothetical protein